MSHHWRSQPWLLRSVAVLLGASLVFSYAPFGYAWWVPLVLLALLWLSAEQSPRWAWRIGFYFGLGWFGAGLSWIYVSIDRFGGLPVVASVALLLLLFSYLSLFPALALALWRWLAQRLGGAALGVLPLCWLLAEWLRGTLFTGFPWLDLGYTQTDSHLGWYAAWLGVSGITLVLWLLASCLYSMLWQRQRAAGLAAIALLSAPFALAQLQPLQARDEQLQVLLVQGNIDQSIKWQPEQHWPTLLRYLELSEPQYASHDIIIWPEAAVTMPEPYTTDVLSNIHRSAAAAEIALITGIIDLSATRYYNSMIVLGQDGADGVTQDYFHGHANRYRKHQLLPIGEFVPLEHWLRPLAPLFDLPMSSFARGDLVQPNLAAAGYQLLPAICYEIAFPQQLRANFTATTDLILTVSNDTWFGRSHGPAQHMQIARMRALELGRPLLRATNSGLTAVVDAYGQTLAQAPDFETTTLSVRVPLVQGTTWFVRYGSWPLWCFASLIALLSIFHVVKRRQNQ